MTVPVWEGSNHLCKVTNLFSVNNILLASAAQLDACPSGSQEVTGLIPAVTGNIHLWRLIMEYFLRPFFPADSRKAYLP